MQQLTIGSKNQVVIPREVRKRISGMKPGKKVLIYTINDTTIALKVADQNWLESSYGAMKHAGSAKQSVKQVEQMRNEWDVK